MVAAGTGSAGQLAPKLTDQGWRGLLPILAADAQPHVRLAPAKAAEVEAGRGKAPGRWSHAGWSLQSDWRTHPDDAGTVEGWARWPGVNVGLRACHAAPWVAFVDVDVLHGGAAAEIQDMLRRRLDHGEFTWRVGDAPKFLVPVQVTEPVRRNRSVVVGIDGQRHMVELLGQGQQAVVAGIHPKTGRAYFWPAGGLEETEPAKLPLLTPAELADIVSACSRILLRHGPAVGRKGRSIKAESSAEPKPLSELRARDPALAVAAAEYVVNADWSRDDFVSWAYALRGAFGDRGKAIWLRFAAQSVKATNPATAEKVWRDATQAERDGLLRAGAGTVIGVARQEGWTPPVPPGLPAYFDAGDTDPVEATAALRLAVANWVEQGLSYGGKGQAPRDAIAGGVGLGKTTVTLQVLAEMAQGRTVHYYAPTLELGDEVVGKARELGLDAVLIRGREANGKDPVRWPALCEKDDVAAILGRAGQNVWESLCRRTDDRGQVTTCEYFDSCPYVRQFDALEGQLVVLAHEWLHLPKPLVAKPDLVVIDERFHHILCREKSLPLGRVTAQRLATPGISDTVPADLTHDAALAMRAVEAGRAMAEVGLSPDRLRTMARQEEMLADAPAIRPEMPYAEQRTRAERLQEVEAFKLAKLWRLLAEDNERPSQRVVLARGIERHGELQDRVFLHYSLEPLIAAKAPVLILDADHDPLIGAATLATNRRAGIRPRLKAEITQVRDTPCSKRKLLDSAERRAEVLALARREAAHGRRVLIGTYKPVADLLRAELALLPESGIEIAHFGAIRGLDRWKSYDSVVVAGREQPRVENTEAMGRALFGDGQEPLLLTGAYVKQSRGYALRDGSRAVAQVDVHPDLRIQALVEQAREREIEQVVGRLRLVHRTRPGRVFLLSSLPTALVVDELTTWNQLMPTKIERAIVAGFGVVPLSYSELARVHPGLWAKAEDARNWRRLKGGNLPIRDSIWKTTSLSALTKVTYRPPGQTRGSPHGALVPGAIRDARQAAAALARLLGPVEQVRIVEVAYRPTVGVVEGAAVAGGPLAAE